jgi:hypothetical protein
MKPGLHLCVLKGKNNQNNGCTHIHQTGWKSVNKHCLLENRYELFSGTGKSTDSGIHATEDHNNVRSILWNLRNCIGPFRTKDMGCWHIVQCFSKTMLVCIQLPTLEHCWSTFNGRFWPPCWSCSQKQPAVLTTWRTGWDHGNSAIMRSGRCQNVADITADRFFDANKQNKQTPWPLVRERTIPTDQLPLVDEI